MNSSTKDQYYEKLKSLVIESISHLEGNDNLVGKEPMSVLICVAHSDGHVHVVMPNWLIVRDVMFPLLSKEVNTYIKKGEFENRPKLVE